MTYEEMGAMMTSDLAKELFDLAYAAGVAAERERCALVCERNIDAPTGTYQILMAAANAIRKGE